MTEQQAKPYRVTPGSELEFYKKLVDPVWGDSSEVNPELEDKLKTFMFHYDKKGALERDSDGEPLITKKNLWALKNYFTRDMRLANLNKDEFNYCVYYLNLGGDCLSVDLLEPFSICLERVATVLELSQSKGGFTLKQSHTFRQESFHSEPEPPKRSLFGMGGKKKEGY